MEQLEALTNEELLDEFSDVHAEIVRDPYQGTAAHFKLNRERLADLRAELIRRLDIASLLEVI